jgi:hypothetical protein
MRGHPKKGGVIQALGMGKGAWTDEEMNSFAPKVYVMNLLSRQRSEPGHIIYQTPQKYCIRFSDHTRYVPKHGVGIINRAPPPRALHVGGATGEHSLPKN